MGTSAPQIREYDIPKSNPVKIEEWKVPQKQTVRETVKVGIK